MGPHIMVEDPTLFSAVILNIYSAPATRLGTMIDVVSTLLIETALECLPLAIEPFIEYV